MLIHETKATDLRVRKLKIVKINYFTLRLFDCFGYQNDVFLKINANIN
ncbi:hypothetical protein LX99_00740 [Mucilaginibacter oryzae]|uniref:Uncharacterized protein n=1 Tax=Mucilaginibacter oryzae TaxID=468058 RepID=A0A316HIC6_9SPHI|nr:hypothetical protein LX99_00740 [Mucilaginibacter oryzae]